MGKRNNEKEFTALEYRSLTTLSRTECGTMILNYLVVDNLLARVRVDSSTDPFDVIDEMIRLAGYAPKGDGKKPDVTATFRAVRITVSEKSDIKRMLRDYRRAKQGCIIPDIGPSPRHDLSDADHLNDERIKAVNALLDDKPALQLVHPNDWGVQYTMLADSPFGLASLAFGERMARSAQLEAGTELFDNSTTTEILHRAAKQAGFPNLRCVEEAKEMMRIVADRLPRNWDHGYLFDVLVDDMTCRPSILDDFVLSVQQLSYAVNRPPSRT